MQEFLVVVEVSGGVASVTTEPRNGVKTVVIDWDNLQASAPEDTVFEADALMEFLTEDPEHAALDTVRLTLSELDSLKDDAQDEIDRSEP